MNADFRLFARRSSWAQMMAGVFCAAILVKLGIEQTVRRPWWVKIGDDIQPARCAPAPGPGPICARDGEVLAESVVRYTIWVDPSRYQNDAERERVAQSLAAATRLPYYYTYSRLARQNRRFEYVLRRTDRDTMLRVASLDLPGVYVTPELGRVYPFGRLAANALGCRGFDNQPLEGIEAIWAFVLDGCPGDLQANQDKWGRIILGLPLRTVPSEPGHRLILTLRLPLQRIVEAAMDDLWARHQPEAATCTILDPRNGDILALSVRPNFDPNDLKHALPEFRKCRQAADVYAPGSTLKTVIVAAALDYGVITTDSRFFCPGTTKVGGQPLGCWDEWRARGHGWVTPREVIAKSCNVAAAQIAMRLGRDRLYEFIDRMQLRDTFSSGLCSEQPGIVLPKDRQCVRGLANIGFGQGIDVTDLHILAWYGALANKGQMYCPNIVREVRRSDGRLVRRRYQIPACQLVKPETAQTVLSFLEAAVQDGTGRAAKIEGLRVGGKTGTAQIWDAAERRHLEGQYVMSFVAVAPIEAPRYVVLVRVVRPRVGHHGSDTALPTAKRVLEAALRLEGAETISSGE